MREFFQFKRFVSPLVLQIVFAVGIVACVVGGLFLTLHGGSRHRSAEIVGGVALIIIGPLQMRLVCEAAIVLFRINDSLREIRDELLDQTFELRQAGAKPSERASRD